MAVEMDGSRPEARLYPGRLLANVHGAQTRTGTAQKAAGNPGPIHRNDGSQRARVTSRRPSL
jgi:hypothetical protein